MLLILSFNFNSKSPLFASYNDKFEVYVGKSASISHAQLVGEKEFPLINGVIGESCEINSACSYEKVFEDFSAELIFIEETEDGVSYYGFSPKIKYREEVNGRKVNLHVHVERGRMKVGSPIIYGSF